MGKQRARRTFEGDHFAGGVHDGRVCGDGPPDGVGRVVHVDDNNLRSVSHLLAHTDEFVRFHGEGGESDVGCVDAHILELDGSKFPVSLSTFLSNSKIMYTGTGFSSGLDLASVLSNTPPCLGVFSFWPSCATLTVT